MEVHHHPQLKHESKPWKEYLLEGLMIFLAVMMGFFAESLREHITDKDKESQYIESMAEDLKSDVKIYQQDIQAEQQRAGMMDSLIAILDNTAQIPGHGDDLYYFARVGPRLKNLIVNMRTFEQLKNSGNFRLISKIGVSNKIMSYYERVTYVKQIEDIYTEEFAAYKQTAAKVFEPAIFRRQEDENGGVKRSTDNPALQKDAAQFTRQIAINAVYMNGSRRGIMVADNQLLQDAKELLKYLQEQYHLKDE